MVVVAILASMIAVASIVINIYLAKVLLSTFEAGSGSMSDEEKALLLNMLQAQALQSLVDDDDDHKVRIAIHDNSAYWVTDEGVMTAPLDDNGDVVGEEAKPLDVIGMDDEEAKLIMEILDALKEEE